MCTIKEFVGEFLDVFGNEFYPDNDDRVIVDNLTGVAYYIRDDAILAEKNILRMGINKFSNRSEFYVIPVIQSLMGYDRISTCPVWELYDRSGLSVSVLASRCPTSLGRLKGVEHLSVVDAESILPVFMCDFLDYIGNKDIEIDCDVRVLWCLVQDVCEDILSNFPKTTDSNLRNLSVCIDRQDGRLYLKINESEFSIDDKFLLRYNDTWVCDEVSSCVEALKKRADRVDLHEAEFLVKDGTLVKKLVI